MMIYSLTQDAIALIAKGNLNRLIEQIGEEDIQRIINSGDAETANKVLERFIKPHLSEDSLDYLAQAMEKLPKIKTLKKEWGL